MAFSAFRQRLAPSTDGLGLKTAADRHHLWSSQAPRRRAQALSSRLNGLVTAPQSGAGSPAQCITPQSCAAWRDLWPRLRPAASSSLARTRGATTKLPFIILERGVLGSTDARCTQYRTRRPVTARNCVMMWVCTYTVGVSFKLRHPIRSPFVPFAGPHPGYTFPRLL